MPSTHGTVTAESGRVTYTPDRGFTGTATFEYRVCEPSEPGAGEEMCVNHPLQAHVAPSAVVFEDLRATPIDPTVPTSLHTAAAFLYTGENPLQRGVVPGTIERRRAAVLRGMVTSLSGEAVPGIRVSVQGHPEFGHTLTRHTGMFDLAVNGGGPMLVVFDAAGAPTTHRQVDVPWGQYVWVDDVVLVPPDASVTTVHSDPRSTSQVHRASSHQTTVVVAPWTTLEPGGAGTITIRSTEYPLEKGRSVLPAAPPPGTPVAYAFELALGDAVVTASRPLVTYVENFLGRTSGSSLPLGRYDRDLGMWVGRAPGRVVNVVQAADGTRQLDVDGDGDGDERDVDGARRLGVTEDELRHVLVGYPLGSSLWRMPLDASGVWAVWDELDTAAGVQPPPAIPAPRRSDPRPAGAPLPGPLAVADTSLVLNPVPADRDAGRRLSIPVTPDAVPASVESIEVRVDVAGQRITTVLPPAPSQVHELVWDGRDGYGRAVRGRFPATITVIYRYAPDHRQSAAAPRTVLLDASGGDESLTGWALEGLCQLDVDYAALRCGAQTQAVGAAPSPQQLGGERGDLQAAAVASGPDGSVYVSVGNQIRRLMPDGTAMTVAGSGAWGFAGDGGPALEAAFRLPTAMAVGRDGALYFVDRWNYRVRRVAPDGTISTVAGNRASESAGEDAVALGALIGRADDLALGPDGTLYLLDRRGILKVGPHGLSPRRFDVAEPLTSSGGSLTVTTDGTLFVADPGRHRIVRLRPEGDVTTLVDEEGLFPTTLAASADGSLTFVDGARIQRLSAEGGLATVVAEGGFDPAVRDLAVAPNGDVSVATAGGLLAVRSAEISSLRDGELSVRSAQGTEQLIFDAFGRHLRTFDVAGGAVGRVFEYDAHGRLTQVGDGTPGATHVRRAADGSVTFVAPTGRQTAVPVRASSLVASVRAMDIPVPVFQAYRSAAEAVRRDLACDLRWSVLAAIGGAESNHGRTGGSVIRADGVVFPHIIGIPLDGRPGVERILDTDAGVLDGDPLLDRAVGPMQILPATWRLIAADGNRDGRADPHNSFDATLGAARYLCRAVPAHRLVEQSDIARAVYSYNRSTAYVATVLADIDRYDSLDPAYSGRGRVLGAYALPLDRAIIDSDPSILGQRHHDYPSVDLPVAIGTPIYAVTGGRVAQVTATGNCGNGVVIDGSDGFRYTYCHAQTVLVGTDERVAAGQLLALSGNSGNSRGPHLHLQIERADGAMLCPQPLLRAWYRGVSETPASAPSSGCTS